MPSELQYLVPAALGAIGLVFGSFLNVVIHRLPLGESIVTPRSRCPGCGAAIPWYQNLPVFSYLVLCGRCAGCARRISIRYPLVELMSGLLLITVYLVFGLSAAFLIFAPFSLAMLALFAIDLEHHLLPDRITKPGIVLGLLVSPWNPRASWLEALAGIALGYGVLWLLAEAYYRLRGESGLGGGDLKLAAMIGAFGGPKAVVEVLLVASLLGTLLGLTLLALRRASMRTALPFGCFLAPVALGVALGGPDLLWEAWQALILRHVYGIGG